MILKFIAHIAVIIILYFHASIANADESIPYPLKNSLMSELNYTYFNGDKLLNTSGADLDLRYFPTENLAISAGAGMYSSKPIDEVSQLQTNSSYPLAYNPKYILRLAASLYAAHGHAVLGDILLYFRLFAELGVHAAGLQSVGTNTIAINSNVGHTRWRYGPYAGAGTWIALNSRFSVQMKMALALEPPFDTNSKDWRKIIAMSLGIGTRFGF